MMFKWNIHVAWLKIPTGRRRSPVGYFTRMAEDYRVVRASLRSKRFQSSYSGNKNKMEGGGGGEKRKHLPANPTILENAPSYCVVPENIHNHPKDGHWKFQRGGGY